MTSQSCDSLRSDLGETAPLLPSAVIICCCYFLTVSPGSRSACSFAECNRAQNFAKEVNL